MGSALHIRERGLEAALPTDLFEWIACNGHVGATGGISSHCTPQKRRTRNSSFALSFADAVNMSSTCRETRGWLFTVRYLELRRCLRALILRVATAWTRLEVFVPGLSIWVYKSTKEMHRYKGSLGELLYFAHGSQVCRDSSDVVGLPEWILPPASWRTRHTVHATMSKRRAKPGPGKQGHNQPESLISQLDAAVAEVAGAHTVDDVAMRCALRQAKYAVRGTIESCNVCNVGTNWHWCWRIDTGKLVHVPHGKAKGAGDWAKLATLMFGADKGARVIALASLYHHASRKWRQMAR